MAMALRIPVGTEEDGGQRALVPVWEWEVGRKVKMPLSGNYLGYCGHSYVMSDQRVAKDEDAPRKEGEGGGDYEPYVRMKDVRGTVV
jgi:hypothetical protein